MDPILLQMISTGAKATGQFGLNVFNNSFGQPTQGDLLREQASAKMGALEETMRRQEGSQTQVLSSTKARDAGTGFASSSESFTNYLQGMADQFHMQDEFTRQQGMKSIDMIDKAAALSDKNQFGVAGTLAGLFK